MEPDNGTQTRGTVARGSEKELLLSEASCLVGSSQVSQGGVDPNRFNYVRQLGPGVVVTTYKNNCMAVNVLPDIPPLIHFDMA